SVLHTIESAWGLASLNTNDGSAVVMTDFYTGVPAPQPCQSAGVSSSPSAAPPGSTLALAASSTSCSNPQYEFWLKRGDGTWGVQQGRGSSAFAWNTSGMAPGAYQLGVWARQSGSAASYDAYAITTGTIAVDS